MIRPGYTDEENSIIDKLEQYADQLNDLLDDKKIELDYEFFYNFLDNLPKNIDEKILNYAEYLRGASMPLYEQTLNVPFEENSNINDLLDSNHYWCDLEKTIKDKNINNIELAVELKRSFEINFNDKDNWAFLIGYYHCFYIYNYKTKLKTYQ